MSDIRPYRDWRSWFGLMLVLAMLMAAGFAIIMRDDAQEIRELRGLDEAALVELLGTPDFDGEMDESDAGPEWRAEAIVRMRGEPPVRVRELVWVGMFRITHVWVELKNGEWVVFNSFERRRWFQPKY